VEDLLDFRRVEAGFQEYRMETLSIPEFIRSVVADFLAMIPDKDYRIDVTCDDAVPSVDVDRRAVGRALFNLLDNAVKYAPRSKTIRVEATTDGNRVAISVHDSGIGIAVRDHKRIFRKFVRAGGAMTADIKGNGLGLAIANQIVLAHGGRIALRSQPDVGSTFTILLPFVLGTAGVPARKPLAT
jgi:signal transduction histidine kinase